MKATQKYDPKEAKTRFIEMKKEQIIKEITGRFSEDINFLKKVNKITYGLFSGQDN